MKKPFAITLDVGTSRANHTGGWRTARPVYVDRMPPCNDACPAGENIQGWLYHAESGDYRRAWEALVEDNPLPAIMGRACYHPCETACNRGQLDAAVGVNSVERFLGDLALREGWPLPGAAPATGKRVLVIGSGPSGLSAAYQLARLGHAVTLREAAPRAGGMMRYGIPRYRLPRDILDAEVKRILDLGVALELGARVSDVAAEMAGFDACFAAVGAHLARRVDIPAPDAGRILEAVSMLRGVEGGEPPRLGRRVVVYGGGNTALDAARTARRLGAEEAVIVYRRTQAHMPAHEAEMEEAVAEGILFHWLRTVKEVGDDGKITVERMVMSEGGKAVPTGELETIEGDTLILALGQSVDLTPFTRVPGVAMTRDGSVTVGPDLMTGHPGLFCGGDMVPAERTITVAVGHGKQAARHIDAYLRGEVYTHAPRPAPATFDRLNSWYYTDADRTAQPTLEGIRRRTTFEEVRGGLDESNALLEARRCLSCGNCFECDNCFGVCPDNAVVKLGPEKGFRIDLDFCKGCGLCAAECPCGAIDMMPEAI